MRLHLAFFTVFVISACGLGYQLIAGSVSSYLLGDSVTQFSLTIGIYLFALGIGSWLSKYVEKELVERFIQVELAVALAGGFSALLLSVAYLSDLWFRPVLYGNIIVVGTLVGVEIPLLMRIVKDELDFKELLAKVLSFDYVGALLVALVFPLFMLPRLGLVRSALVLGLLNAIVGLWSVSLFKERIARPQRLRIASGLCILICLLGLQQAGHMTRLIEHEVYAGEILHSQTTPYQRIVVTRTGKDFQLLLSGALQFNSGDEYRYHEALVHPAFGVVDEPRRVLVLGGGDGLAVREILRHDAVERVMLVDLDPAVTELARELPLLVELNGDSLRDPRVQVVNADAMGWIAEQHSLWDVIIVDFPDPASFSLGKLYTRTFYERLAKRLAPGGAVAVQSTNPRMAPKSYWCIKRTMEDAGWFVRPYHASVPSFGVWGYMLAAQRAIEVPTRLPAGLRFLDEDFLPTLFVLPKDAHEVEVESNRLSTQALVRYYEDELSP